MKSVLISIQPRWVELIANGKKTMEVRKSMPKLETPFKCYIYCTNKKPLLVWGDVFRGNWETEFTHLSGYGRKEAEKIWDIFNGKVAGEFLCDRIEPIACHKRHNGVGFDYSYYTESNDTLTSAAKLSDYDLQRYLGVAEDGEVVGYAWHISKLVIYDTPKELGEFRTLPCEKHESACDNCKHKVNAGSYYYPDYDCAYENGGPIMRPPQSWQYIKQEASL